MRKSVRKILRFVGIYGVSRTLYKAAGRMRRPLFTLPWHPGRKRRLGIIGCGQYAFATIGYFLRRQRDANFAICYDPDTRAAESFARFYGVPEIAVNSSEVLAAPDVEIVYVASNHASHAEYACSAMRAGKLVYVEKPVAVSLEQLQQLSRTRRAHGGRIYAGYNRPFSAAVQYLRQRVTEPDAPLTLSCFVMGHVLAPDHWYRREGEGTRICGNVGHWLDLAVHMLRWGTMPDQWNIALTWADDDARDDNLAICLRSKRGDLINIVLSARTEPFEGINESINLQWGPVIAKVDDFRSMTLWEGDRLSRRRYWPKDVGHGAAIQQPFHTHIRDWHEIELSTLLMLQIADMVRNAQREANFSFAQHSTMLLD